MRKLVLMISLMLLLICNIVSAREMAPQQKAVFKSFVGDLAYVAGFCGGISEAIDDLYVSKEQLKVSQEEITQVFSETNQKLNNLLALSGKLPPDLQNASKQAIMQQKSKLNAFEKIMRSTTVVSLEDVITAYQLANSCADDMTKFGTTFLLLYPNDGVEYKVNVDMYRKVTNGMTYFNVIADAFGANCCSTLVSSKVGNGELHEVYSWNAENNKKIYITFKNNKVVSKSMQ